MKHSRRIVIHINDTFDSNKGELFSSKVKKFKGVVSASVQTKNPHLMIVNFNNCRTRAKAIVNNIRSTGKQAQIVGWL